MTDEQSNEIETVYRECDKEYFYCTIAMLIRKKNMIKKWHETYIILVYIDRQLNLWTHNNLVDISFLHMSEIT